MPDGTITGLGLLCRQSDSRIALLQPHINDWQFGVSEASNDTASSEIALIGRLLADAELEKAALKEIARGNF